MPDTSAGGHAAPIPRSFVDYLRSFGPGLVMVLTWLGAGDVIDMATAGANYGYALMWMFVVAVLLRFLFVSLIARYQLCNQHGEGVLDGLARLHPLYPPLIFAAVVVMGHIYGAYMSVGIGEIGQQVAGAGEPWLWALLFNGIAVALVFRPSYRRLEAVFLVFLAVLSVSFLGSALWVGFDAGELLRGLVRIEMPGRHGTYDPWHVALAMVGAVGGSLMNLVYPYFLEAKGWRGPRYRRVQLYDLLLGILVMLVLNLAVWILGAELLFPDRHIEQLEDLPQPADRRPRARRRPALLRRALRRGLHLARRTRRRSRLPGQPRLAALAGRPRRADPGAAGPPDVPVDRAVVPGLAAGLDAARDAGIRLADADGQQRARGAAARPGRRPVVDHREPPA